MVRLRITPDLSLDEQEIVLEFIRASGPGGQNVNKVSSAVQLRFDVRASPSLPEEVKARLIRSAGARVNANGILVIEAKRYRSQENNRLDAINRLVTLIQRAAQPPKPRKATRPTATSRTARREEKQHRSQTKRLRSNKPDEWE